MKNIFSVIFMNFWGYDLIIFIAAVLTAVMYFSLKKSADGLYNKMHLTVFVPDGNLSRKEADNDISGLRETDIVTMRNNMGKLYSIFVNLTGIFPLLGILGTVISLLGLVSDTNDITGNFYGALTSTFWGLVFAIIFKFLDGIISAKIEDNEKNVALYLDRNNTQSMNIPSHEEIISHASLRQTDHLYNSRYAMSDSGYPKNIRKDYEDNNSDSDQEVMKILNSIN
ncbi:MAG: MotA/TolQ/ExbB proton channel family protein [Ruminococcus sp.]|nr:MotA/TolQ/ExbB proton channel family protein [Ruminococcus sp.]